MTSARTLLRTGLTAASLVVCCLQPAGSFPRQLSEGDSCVSGGVSGSCRLLMDCPSARRDLQRRRPPPTRCGFVGYQEVVCCTEAAHRGVAPSVGFDTNGVDYGISSDVDDDDSSEEYGGGRRGGWDARRQPGTPRRRSVAACERYKDELSSPTYHILSGKAAQKEEFPHMAALGYQEPGRKQLSWLCGGSLISDQFVLTAAHCCSSRERSAPVRVQLGTLNLTAARGGNMRYGIRDIIIHGSYKKPYYHGDIALLRLDRKVSFSDSVSPACLYTKRGDPPRNLIVTGWGATNAIGTKQSPVLLKTTIRQFPLLQCESKYREKFPEGLDSTVICAGDPQGKSDICGGDSGGPLQTQDDAFTYSIVGIASIGPDPCGGNVPSLYTRISSYIEWIEKYVWS